ncbi:MAG: hypothetical protein ABJB95_03285 [Gemmatimonadales bacterium]
MFGSTLVYSGLVIAAAGVIFVIKPVERLHVTSRSQGLAIVGMGLLLAGIGFMAPASEKRVDKVEKRLDEFVPVWQFSERHTIEIDAPPERVFDAIKRVRGDEISFFQTLTWIRRGGRSVPESILNAGSRESLIDVAVKSGFVRLAEDPPRELVIGIPLTPQVFGALDFVVTPAGLNSSSVSTETRVFASSPAAQRRFAIYWRTIYPGSALIRRMWLRAVRRRATTAGKP